MQILEMEKKKEDKSTVPVILKASAKQLVIIEVKWNKIK